MTPRLGQAPPMSPARSPAEGPLPPTDEQGPEAIPCPARAPSWEVQDPAGEPSELEALTQQLGISRTLATLLAHRGFVDPQGARIFLEPSLKDLEPPEHLPDLDRAADRLVAAIDGGEPILIYGDYDVDGLTGTRVLQKMLGHLGADVRTHIPNRFTEGYGLQEERMRRAAEEGVRVVVSVDTGATAFGPAEVCRELGLDLIVTDHHTIKDSIPPVYALVHPRAPGSTAANTDLCGAGVAFKLAWHTAVRKAGRSRLDREGREVLLGCLAYVALGTVADVVSLMGENRILVTYGLRVMEANPDPGLRALLAASRAEAPYDATQVAFRIAPRINAAGRMGDAGRVLRLFGTLREAEAQELAKEIDGENRRRQQTQAEVLEQARAVARELDRPGLEGLVVAGEDWHEGVLGIVASKLVEEFGRPAIVLTIKNGSAKGSGRTHGPIDLYAITARCEAHLSRFGGHRAAIGLTLEAENLEAFQEAFAQAARAFVAENELADALGRPPLGLARATRLDELSLPLVEELRKLGPFGQGNPEPVFGTFGVELAGRPRTFGAGDHFAFYVSQGGVSRRVVAFNRPELGPFFDALERLRPGDRPRFDVACKVGVDTWGGNRKVELQLVDLRLCF